MPPKRKAAGAAGGSAAKKGKKAAAAEPAPAPPTSQDKIDALKKADVGKTKKHKVDALCSLRLSAEVFEDYDCMLNQTNIGHNNNKYYVIQLLKLGTNFYTWNRWGRVGEPGQSALKGPMGVDAAKKDFEKKFSDKTRNKWASRADFKPSPGKYTMLDMAGEEEDDVDTGPVVAATPDKRKVLPSKLEGPTQKLLKLIFDHDMFREAMKSFDIDVKKMPLGKLSKTQIAKGFEVLDELEAALKNKAPKNKLTALSSRFYTVIPHDFGRRVPPTIVSAEVLQQKMDMLNVLADIEIAQSLQKDASGGAAGGDTVPNPLDENYKSLLCQLAVLDPKCEEFKVLETYTQNTMGYRKVKIQHVWTVDREGTDDRFKAHDKITNRKLLWHGTNVAVVAAILRTGLRIMPHSGGRVGSGIYFASENGKSAGYVRCAGKTGIMFLTEVALGKEKQIERDDSSLKAAPSGFDCVVAMGRTEPDPKDDTTLTMGGKKVTVPKGKPINRPAHSSSSFSQSEYLVYKESQQRLRYLLMLTFDY